MRRAYLLVRLEDSQGRAGFGEASPLPGYSRDTLEDAVDCLEGRSAVSLDPDRPLSLDTESLSPSARFALEVAALSWASRAQRRPLWSFFGAREVRSRPSAVLLDTLEQARTKAERLYAKGARGFKVKVGRPGKEEAEATLLRWLRERFGEKVELRADANQSLSPDFDGPLWRAMQEAKISMLEEPFPWEEDRYARAPEVPFALDESLRNSEGCLQGPLRSGRISALVLKPGLHGLGGCLRWIEQARARSLQVVISHMFERPHGLAAIAALALAKTRPDEMAGLGYHEAMGARPSYLRTGWVDDPGQGPERIE